MSEIGKIIIIFGIILMIVGIVVKLIDGVHNT